MSDWQAIDIDPAPTVILDGPDWRLHVSDMGDGTCVVSLSLRHHGDLEDAKRRALQMLAAITPEDPAR